jgi:hypothetical protein
LPWLRGCLSGALRLYYIVLICYHTYDVTWYGHYLYAWSIAETELTLICASAPAVRPLFKKFLGGTIGRSGASGSDPYVSGGSGPAGGRIGKRRSSWREDDPEMMAHYGPDDALELGKPLPPVPGRLPSFGVTGEAEGHAQVQVETDPWRLPPLGADGVVFKEVSVDVESMRLPSNAGTV